MRIRVELLPAVEDWDSENPSQPVGTVVQYHGVPHQVIDYTEEGQGHRLSALESYDKAVVDWVETLTHEHKVKDGDLLIFRTDGETPLTAFNAMRKAFYNWGYTKVLFMVLTKGIELEAFNKPKVRGELERMLKTLAAEEGENMVEIYSETEKSLMKSLESVASNGVSFEEDGRMFECTVIPSRTDGFSGVVNLDQSVPPRYPRFQGSVAVATDVVNESEEALEKGVAPFFMSMIEHALKVDGVKNITDIMTVRVGHQVPAGEEVDRYLIEWWFYGDRTEDDEE